MTRTQGENNLPGLTAPPAPVERRRFLLVVGGLTLVFLALALRLAGLQAWPDPEAVRSAERNLSSHAALRGLRGDIVTRDGTIVAREVIEYAAGVDPKLISPANRSMTIDLLSRELGLSDEERRGIHRRWMELRDSAARGERPEPRYLPIRRGVRAGLVDELKPALERVLPPAERRGVVFSPIHYRRYPQGEFLGSVVGAVKQGMNGDDLEGVEGIERAFDASLGGRDGYRNLRKEGRSLDRWFWPGEVEIPAVHGYNAVLTIDCRIQGIAEEELERGIERERAAAGIVIVLDCQSGAVLAMANRPSFDPNHYHDYPEREFAERRRNRAIESQFEPGSTIKPFVAAVALEKKLFSPDQRIWDGGRVKFFGRRRVEDVSDHGPISFAEAVIFSSNVGMAHIGLRLGRDGLIEVLDRFRFQQRTGLGLPGEAVGKRTARKEWSENYSSVSVSIGYEVMMTPIQLCAAFASVINGGRYFAPRLVERLERGGEIIPFPPQDVARPILEETSRRMREILVGVVERGTAKGVKIPGFSYGGKTGTARTAGEGGYVAPEYLSSFIAFAPAEEPRVVVLAMIERPKIRHYGSTVAGPVVAGILRRTFRIEEDQRRKVPSGAIAPVAARMR